MAEERISERFDLPVEIGYSVPGKGELRGETKARNISFGGVQFQVKERIDPGSIITMQIFLPRRLRATTAKGEVVWLKENRISGKGFHVGVRFLQADPYDLEELLLAASVSRRI